MWNDYQKDIETRNKESFYFTLHAEVIPGNQ